MDTNKELTTIHKMLAITYKRMLDEGCSDPRILKEVREFLKDNGVAIKAIDQSVPDSAVISMDLEEELFKLVSND